MKMKNMRSACSSSSLCLKLLLECKVQFSAKISYQQNLDLLFISSFNLL
jgi:hypothetical protein